MSRCFRIYLAWLTAAATLVVVFPPIVLAGVYFFIVPGLLLGIAPTLLIYTVLWWGLQAAMLWGAARLGANPARRVWRWPTSVLAALAVAAPAVTIPKALNEPDQATSKALRAQDKDTNSPIPLPETILYRKNASYSQETRACDDVCLRLLYNGAVKKVVTAFSCTSCSPPRESPPLAFWIERRDYCGEFNKHGSVSLVFPMDRIGSSHSPEYAFRARMEAGECVAYGPGDPHEAMLTLNVDEHLKRGTHILTCPWCLTERFLKAGRLEVHGSDGTLLYRRTGIERQPLSAPLFIEVRSVEHLAWGRGTQADTSIGPYGRDVLGGVFGAAVRLPDMPKLTP